MRLFLILAFAFAALPATAQPEHDQEVTWRSYDGGAPRAVRVRVFASGDERRPHTVVVDDRASNGQTPVTDEAPYVADTIARELGFNPVEASFVFRFTAASFAEDGRDTGKTVLLRATFQRTSSGALGAPNWRVLTSEGLEDLTDRQMR